MTKKPPIFTHPEILFKTHKWWKPINIILKELFLIQIALFEYIKSGLRAGRLESEFLL